MKLATLERHGISGASGAGPRVESRQERPDVFCLQEIKATSDQVPTALC
jgi:exonuclease III